MACRSFPSEHPVGSGLLAGWQKEGGGVHGVAQPGTPPGVAMHEADPAGQAPPSEGWQGGAAPPQQGFTQTSPPAQLVAPQATGLAAVRRPITGAADGKVKGTSTHDGSFAVARHTGSPPSGCSSRPSVAHMTATYGPGAAKRLRRHWFASAPHVEVS
jgi:hypothetical protein